jgi:hypothetical protein
MTLLQAYKEGFKTSIAVIAVLVLYGAAAVLDATGSSVTVDLTTSKDTE